MIESKREIDYTGLFLILVLLFMAAVYLRSTQWTPNLDLVFIAMFCGFGIGFLLARSSFDRASIFWLAIAFTLIFLLQIFSLVFDASIPVIGRLFLIIHQAGVSVHEFTSGNTISSPLIFLLTFTMIFWLLSLLGAIAYVRHRRFLPMMICALVILILVEYFLPERERNHWVTSLAVFAGFLLYLHDISYKISLKALMSGIPISGKFQWTFNPAFLAIISVIVFIAWSVPLVVRAASPGTPEAQRFNRFSYQVRDNFFRMTASLRGGTRSAAIGFGPSLPLGDRAADKETTVFTAIVSREIPSIQRTYWRSKVYESYQDSAWQVGEQKQMLLEPETEFIQPRENPRESVVTYRVKASLPLGDYFIPGELVSINNPANIIFSPKDDGGRDIIAVEPENTVLPGNGYRMSAVIKTVEEPDLTERDGEFPDWVMRRYLQVPASISPAVQKLALEITEGKTSNYEKAVAVTDHLRSNYDYQPSVNFPENGRDRIEWFLFDEKKGYCNYFASAEVMLLRSMGIPARLAVGFSEGDLSEDGLTYTVKEKHRHAWPEVYFPEAGWVIFEPTSSQPELIYSISENYLPSQTELRSPDEPLDPEVSREKGVLLREESVDKPEIDRETASQKPEVHDVNPFFLLMGATLVVVLLILVFGSSRNSRFYILQKIQDGYLILNLKVPIIVQNALLSTRTPEIEYVYNDTVRLGTILYKVEPGNKTPKETMNVIISKCPVIKSKAEELLDEYQNSVFGGKVSDDQKARILGRNIQLSMIRYKVSTWARFMSSPGNGK